MSVIFWLECFFYVFILLKIYFDWFLILFVFFVKYSFDMNKRFMLIKIKWKYVNSFVYNVCLIIWMVNKSVILNVIFFLVLVEIKNVIFLEGFNNIVVGNFVKFVVIIDGNLEFIVIWKIKDLNWILF